MRYLGREFKNYEEMYEWSKSGLIAEYRRLSEMFSRNPSMELSCLMSNHADALVRSYGLTWEEIEALEVA